ncbi:MAG TPA: ribosomal-processing cysteine protease Prp [Defluviitaleaceae bacterium]|nr:ribosomal-processing cysteine protease Prp [Defluviitaleaceae bacterium]
MKVVFYLNKNKQLCGFEISGHAGYGKYGSDIVCAAVSTLAINTVNSIEVFSSDPICIETDKKDGLMIFSLDEKAKAYPADETLLFLKSLELGLKNIQKNYKKHILISYKEV